MAKQATKAPSGGKASALKRLKASLKEAGVIGKNRGSQSKKQRQGNNAIEAGNAKEDKRSLIKDAFNPFEIKSTKSKHDILGRKLKGASGRPTLSKQVGDDNRKNTLLKEYNNKLRTGTIVDRRFGENDANMTPEEKMLERFAKEKQKKVRNSSIFNLEDEAEIELTHMGQALADIDDFNEPIASDEDDKGGIDRNTVHADHFGGFETKDKDSERPKSKAEVMKEVIAKSKFHKYEKQKLKEDDERIRQELDDELDDIKSLLFSAQPSEPKIIRKPLESQASMFKKTNVPEDKDKEQSKAEDYDKFIRELAYEQRAHATDRTKTDEELALEEKEKLEKAERHRLRRMQGIDSDSEDDNSKVKKRSKRAAQADDLDDDFEQDDNDVNFGLGEGVKVRVIDPNNKKDESEEEEEEGSEEEGDEENEEDEEDYSEGEEDGSDLESEEGEELSDEEMEPIQKKKTIDPKLIDAASKELPYTFPLPKTHEELFNLIANRQIEEHKTFLKRARVLYHPRLSTDNKELMETFIFVLLEHVEYLGNDKVCNKELVNIYYKNIIELAQLIPDCASRASIKFIKESHEQFKSELNSSSNSIPNPGQLLVFSLFCQLYSVSDYHHAVISPMLLFLGQVLLQSNLASPICLARFLYIVGLFYEIVASSRRYIPEALSSLYTILTFLAPKDAKSDIILLEDVFFNKFQIENNNLFEKLSKIEVYNKVKIDDNNKDGLKFKLKFKDLLLSKKDTTIFKEEFIVNLLVVTIRNIRKFADLYGHHSDPLSCLPQAFESFFKIINKYEESKLVSDSLKEYILEQKEYIQTLVDRCASNRYPLQLQQHRALAIKTLLPKFDAEYSLDKRYDDNLETKEMDKLKRQHKRELKGAIRELRKDTQFLAREKLKRIKLKDQQYKDKIKGIMGELANNQGDQHKFSYEKKYKRGQQ